MDIKDSVINALDTMSHSKLRAGLTILGIVIGIAAVIILVSLGEGAKAYIVNQIQRFGFGANSLHIQAGQLDPSELSLLSLRDCTLIKQKIPEVTEVAPDNMASVKVKFGNREKTIPVIGTTANYPAVASYGADSGRFFSELDVAMRKRVIVLGRTTATRLFGGINPIGEAVKVGSTKFQVIGLMEKKGFVLMFDVDEYAYIPITTAEDVLGSKRVVEVLVKVRDKEQVEEVAQKITALLIKEHRGKEDFKVRTPDQIMSILDNILGVLTFFVGGVAAISLLVGGIGIMNIMIVSVTERTREIGIRKAVGARKEDIFTQFLIEAVVMSCAGGAIGIILGYVVSFLLSVFAKLTMVVPLWSVLLATIFAFAVGIFSGLYPAMRAAGMDPIEALRYE